MIPKRVLLWRHKHPPATQVMALVLGLGNVKTLDIPQAVVLLVKALTDAARPPVRKAAN